MPHALSRRRRIVVVAGERPGTLGIDQFTDRVVKVRQGAVFIELRDRAFFQRRWVVDGTPDMVCRSSRWGALLAHNDHRELARAESVDHAASETPGEFLDIAIGRLVAVSQP